MSLDFLKIGMSLLPFIKEAFLWRDGAEQGRPITQQNLIRRQIAVFVLIGSIVFNYFLTAKTIEEYKIVGNLKREIIELKKQSESSKSKVCPSADELKTLILDEISKRHEDKKLSEQHDSLSKPKRKNNHVHKSQNTD
jgi:hypothetical protein